MPHPDVTSASALAHYDPETRRGHRLDEHLRAVGTLAAAFAAPWGGQHWAELAGVWHDLGKYAAEFQARLRAADADAHIEGSAPGRVDHSTAGALHALERFRVVGRETVGRMLAYCIAGHHAGLADWSPDNAVGRALSLRLREVSHLDRATRGHPAPTILDWTLPATPGNIDCALWIRMLFSALVDADFLDTEQFYDAGRAGARIGYPDVAALVPVLHAHMDLLQKEAPPTAVNVARAEVLAQCWAQASMPPGVFSLTVPTGGGKTLASLAFALAHARAQICAG